MRPYPVCLGLALASRPTAPGALPQPGRSGPPENLPRPREVEHATSLHQG